MMSTESRAVRIGQIHGTIPSVRSQVVVVTGSGSSPIKLHCPAFDRAHGPKGRGAQCLLISDAAGVARSYRLIVWTQHRSEVSAGFCQVDPRSAFLLFQGLGQRGHARQPVWRGRASRRGKRGEVGGQQDHASVIAGEYGEGNSECPAFAFAYVSNVQLGICVP